MCLNTSWLVSPFLKKMKLVSASRMVLDVGEFAYRCTNKVLAQKVKLKEL